MKKIFCLLSFLLVLNFQSKAQGYDSSDALLNVGVGLFATHSLGTGLIPPLSVSYEKNFGMLDELTIGGYFGFNSSKNTVTSGGDEYGYRYRSIIFGARGAYHFHLADKWDTYAGLMLAYEIHSSTNIGNLPPGFADNSNGGFRLPIFVGGRYYFQDSMSAFAEAGYGISFLTLGISLKM